MLSAMGRNSAVCFLFAASIVVAGCDSVSGLDTDAPKPAGTTTTASSVITIPAITAPPMVATTVPATTTPRTPVTTTAATPLTACADKDSADPLADCTGGSTESTDSTTTKPHTSTSMSNE